MTGACHVLVELPDFCRCRQVVTQPEGICGFIIAGHGVAETLPVPIILQFFIRIGQQLGLAFLAIVCKDRLPVVDHALVTLRLVLLLPNIAWHAQ